jgi:prevent-host-death family protein
MFQVMKQISIQDLKASLSAAIAEAESGKTIVITRHNEAVAQLIPAQSRHVHRPKKTEAGGLTPAIKRATKGRYLDALLQDRSDR